MNSFFFTNNCSYLRSAARTGSSCTIALQFVRGSTIQIVGNFQKLWFTTCNGVGGRGGSTAGIVIGTGSAFFRSSVLFGHPWKQPSPRTNTLYRAIHIEHILQNDLGIELPPAPKPKANYNIVCRASGNMLYLSGHLPLQNNGNLIVGRIGPESSGGKTIEHGYEAAKQCGLNIIATLKEQLGDLDRVEQIVKVGFEGRLVISFCFISKVPHFVANSIFLFFVFWFTIFHATRYLELSSRPTTLKSNIWSWMVART